MNILNINLVNFRNLIDQKIVLSRGINLFYGKNAQGKTSILEALYFTSMGISFRTKKISEIMKYGENKMGSYIEASNDIGISSYAVKYLHRKSATKQFLINNKSTSQSNYFGSINMIVYVPEDIAIINGGPQIRRNFFDIEIAQYDRNYLNDLKNYNKILKIRNKFIKDKQTSTPEYEIYNKTYIEYSAKILMHRFNYIHKLSLILSNIYKNLFKTSENLSICYKTFIDISEKDDFLCIYTKIKNKLELAKEREKIYGFSLIGAHKDDYLFILKDIEAKISASQGEKKSIIFALKLSEIDILKKYKKEKPVVLIDDITSYFDNERRNAILNYLIENRLQVVISSTEDININSKKFYVKEGVVHENV